MAMNDETISIKSNVQTASISEGNESVSFAPRRVGGRSVNGRELGDKRQK